MGTGAGGAGQAGETPLHLVRNVAVAATVIAAGGADAVCTANEASCACAATSGTTSANR